MTLRSGGFIVFTAVFLFLGCDGHHDEHHSGDSADHGHDGHPSAEAESAMDESVDFGMTLNGSQKWPMDDHTRLLFARMAERTAGPDTDALTGESLKESGVQLRADIDELIAGCTMEGAAHNELHKYLVLLIPAVNELEKSGDSPALARVQTLLKLYPQYFE